MTKSNSLTYYPRFVLTCSDGQCLSTTDLAYLEYVKDASDNYGGEITQFVPGQRINITWDGEAEARLYEVDKIEIHQIKYDLDKRTTGGNSNDCTITFGDKKPIMDIYVFLNAVK